MKREMFLWMSVLLLMIAGLSSCCCDDESDLNSQDVVYESNPKTINGTWHLVSANYGFGRTEKYQAGEISVTFNEATKTMSIEDKKNINFLKSGNYPYEITTEKRRIYTYQWVDVENQVIVIHYSDEVYGNRDVRYVYSFYDGMLVLDGGMASDGPGYYFKKIKDLSN